jgi:hypothetical protein
MEKSKKCPTCGHMMEKESDKENKKENFKEIQEKTNKMMMKKK